MTNPDTAWLDQFENGKGGRRTGGWKDVERKKKPKKRLEEIM